MKETSRFLPFRPDFSSFFPIFPDFFPDFFPIFGIFFTVRGGTLPPCHPSGYATGASLTGLGGLSILYVAKFGMVFLGPQRSAKSGRHSAPSVIGLIFSSSSSSSSQPNDWTAALDSLQVDRNVPEVDWATPGSKAGLLMLEDFCQNRLKYFDGYRNDPTKSALSNLSPWFHFGKNDVYKQKYL